MLRSLWILLATFAIVTFSESFNYQSRHDSAQSLYERVDDGSSIGTAVADTEDDDSVFYDASESMHEEHTLNIPLSLKFFENFILKYVWRAYQNICLDVTKFGLLTIREITKLSIDEKTSRIIPPFRNNNKSHGDDTVKIYLSNIYIVFTGKAGLFNQNDDVECTVKNLDIKTLLKFVKTEQSVIIPQLQNTQMLSTPSVPFQMSCKLVYEGFPISSNGVKDATIRGLGRLGKQYIQTLITKGEKSINKIFGKLKHLAFPKASPNVWISIAGKPVWRSPEFATLPLVLRLNSDQHQMIDHVDEQIRTKIEESKLKKAAMVHHDFEKMDTFPVLFNEDVVRYFGKLIPVILNRYASLFPIDEKKFNSRKMGLALHAQNTVIDRLMVEPDHTSIQFMSKKTHVTVDNVSLDFSFDLKMYSSVRPTANGDDEEQRSWFKRWIVMPWKRMWQKPRNALSTLTGYSIDVKLDQMTVDFGIEFTEKTMTRDELCDHYFKHKECRATKNSFGVLHSDENGVKFVELNIVDMKIRTQARHIDIKVRNFFRMTGTRLFRRIWKHIIDRHIRKVLTKVFSKVLTRTIMLKRHVLIPMPKVPKDRQMLLQLADVPHFKDSSSIVFPIQLSMPVSFNQQVNV